MFSKYLRNYEQFCAHKSRTNSELDYRLTGSKNEHQNDKCLVIYLWNSEKLLHLYKARTECKAPRRLPKFISVNV